MSFCSQLEKVMGSSKASSMGARLTLAAITLAAATNAHAETSLALTPTSTECVQTSTFSIRPDLPPTTWTQRTPCTTPVTVEIFRDGTTRSTGERYLVMNLQFTYTDDGLSLGSPTALNPGELLRAGQPAPFVTFEAGVLWIDVSSASSLYSVSAFAQASDPNGITARDGYILFGDNDHPDSFTGTISLVLSGPSTSTGLPYTSARIDNVDVGARLASVPAIPEPSTYALMGVGLAAIAAGAWRRRSSAAVRREDPQAHLVMA
jgi:hypothetical protein